MGQVLASYNYQNPWFYDTVQGPLPGASLWEQFAHVLRTADPFPLCSLDLDFVGQSPATNTVNGWTFTAATSGTITEDTTNPNGVFLIDAGAVTASQGVNWQTTGSPFKVAANKPVAFEIYGQFSGLTSLKLQFFCGLAATSTAIIASAAMATLDRVGFQGIFTSGGTINSVCRGGGTAVTGTGLTLANTTNYRLGFLATSSSVSFFVNGALVNTITSQIPTGALAPSIVVQANGSVQPVLHLDYLRVAGYRN